MYIYIYIYIYINYRKPIGISNLDLVLTTFILPVQNVEC